MMKQLKLKDLYKACKVQMEAGNGEKNLIVAGDNEGNFYHGMFFALTLITPDIEEGFRDLIGDNSEPDLNNLIVVG